MPPLSALLGIVSAEDSHLRGQAGQYQVIKVIKVQLP